ncbi:MAG: glycoside-pentoside-hexuronide (GPH):cation symporter [Treponema sp.]|jgi:GPH family glycoside/pentoside/hexuronide:cation symporter|nr:glycoside-pentoside-hexuronide (GPH):cation symporter [Treponema sp.]
MAEQDFSARTQRINLVIAGSGQSGLLTFITTFIMVYLVEYAHISSRGIAAVTVIMSVAKIFDALNDPFMGSIVDKTRSRWGKLRPYIIFSAAPVAITSALLFCLPDTSETLKIVFFGICYVVWGVCYTLCDVPYWTLIGAVFSDTGDRTKTIGHVRAFQSIATALVTLGAPWIARFLSFGGGGATTAGGWSLAAILVALTGMGLFTRAFFGTRERSDLRRHEAVGFKSLFATLFKNKPLFMVLLGSILGFGRTIIQAGGAVFVVVAYNNEGYFTLIGAAIITGMILASFLAPALLKRWSSKTVILLSSLVGTLFNIVMYFTGFQNIPLMMGLIFVNGLSLGLFMVVQTTMIADAVDAIERRTGVRNDGISFSSLTFVSKLMGTLAVLVFGIVLSATGYQEGVVVTASMQNLVFMSITLIPAASCLVSMLPFALYRLDR